MQFDIVLIKPNNTKIDLDNINILENILESHTIIFENMMSFIVQNIGLTTELMGSTSMCYENEKYVYQMCHLNLEDNGQKNDENNFNQIASQLASTDVYGNAIMIASEISENNQCVSKTIKLDEIIKIFKSKIVHKGIKIDTNNNISEFNFYKDPMEFYSKEDVTNFQWMELPIFNFNFIVFMQVNPQPNTINKLMTKIVGRHIINGISLLVSKSTENEFIDMDMELFNKLSITLDGLSLESRDLLEDEKKNGELVNNLPIVMNRYCILEKRYNAHNNKCNNNNCENEKNNLICSGCYRMKYCSKECQLLHWKKEHNQDCLFDKKSINSSLKIDNETN